MLYIGIDPDLHSTAIVALYSGSHDVSLDVLRVPASIKGLDAAMQMALRLQEFFWRVESLAQVGVEAQDITYSARSGANPNDLLMLAYVTGAVLGAASPEKSVETIRCWRPREWKGSVPKHIHQARSYERMGWKYHRAGGKSPYCVPEGIEREGINPGDWKHLGDALGLALKVKDEWLKERKVT